MIVIPFDENLANNTWKFWHLSGGRLSIVTRCANGHIGTLDHQITEDGTVSPSVVCQHAGCNFHEFIRLEGWRERMAEWEMKVSYYVKSGDGYVTEIGSEIPVMASSKSLAVRFLALETAQACAEKLLALGFAATIEPAGEISLEE